jgi:hypothetical protein
VEYNPVTFNWPVWFQPDGMANQKRNIMELDRFLRAACGDREDFL